MAECPKCKKEYELEEHGYYQCDDCKTYFYFPEGFRLCPFCHGEIPASASKCQHCGEWLNKNASKSRSTYLLLTFLLGNLGAGEFYAGKHTGGFILLILSLLAGVYCGQYAFFYLGIIWAFAVLNAFLSDVGKQKQTNWMFYGTTIIGFLFLAGIFAFLVYFAIDTKLIKF